jgi:tRNA A37 N6-isopentenylltransferase MiaA
LKRKDRARQIAAAFTPQNQRVFIAGPTGCVESTEEIVLAIRVPSELLNEDSFDGY